MANEKQLSSKGQAWFCTTGLPSDVVIEVDDMSFHLHKFPLMSKSKKLNDMITEREQNHRIRTRTETEDDQENIEEEMEEEEEELPHISLPSFPGGSEAFETAAKFCYGVKIDLTAGNAAALRCASEYLEMSEEFSEENLISRTDRFLGQSVLRSLKNSVRTLKSCQDLLPLADELGIVDRCIESIAGNSTDQDHGGLFGWPIKEGSGREEIRGSKNRNRAHQSASSDHFWFEELSILSLPIYKRLISAMKERDFNSDIIETSLISYAKRSIPGISRSNRNMSISAASALATEVEQRELLEAVITNLPLEKSCGGVNTTRFLFRLLRTINILRASDASRTVLERKIAAQLELASLDDLLMPSYSYLAETLYDVDSVERILMYYLEGLENNGTVLLATGRGEELVAVGKLVDGYLGEIASDGNLKPDKFCDLAMALPDRARVFDDGLYRAVDLYLKAHPRISEEEREKVCGVMDCRKLTLEACTHAAQNERLPLRAVVQVLFFEQLQLRQAIAGTLIAADTARASEERSGSLMPREANTWRTAIRENQVLRLDMDSMRNRVHDLERECSNMKKVIDKVDRKVGRTSGQDRESLARRFGCKFRTKVCDSHERTVMEPRRSQTEHQHTP